MAVLFLNAAPEIRLGLGAFRAIDDLCNKALGVHLQDLDFRAGQIHLEPDPPHTGTEQLSTYVKPIPFGGKQNWGFWHNYARIDNVCQCGHSYATPVSTLKLTYTIQYVDRHLELSV